ncbi:MAG: sugar phosphate isomerase/epimerase family protein [Planctomycetota bacterium]
MFQPRLGVSLHTIATELTEPAISAVARSRIRTLELFPRIFEGDDAPRKVDMVKVMCRERGIEAASVHVPFGGPHDISVLDEAARGRALKTFEEAVPLAIQFDAPLFVVHASAEPIEADHRSRRLDQARKSLAQIVARCAALKKRVAVELLPRTCLGNSVEELLLLLDGLDPQIAGVCLDTNHFMDRYATLPGAVRSLGDRLFALHLSDYDGVDEKHQTPGTGVIDWKAFLRALRDIAYAGPFDYECKLEGDTVEERINRLETNFDWLCSLL